MGLSVTVSDAASASWPWSEATVTVTVTGLQAGTWAQGRARSEQKREESAAQPAVRVVPECQWDNQPERGLYFL